MDQEIPTYSNLDEAREDRKLWLAEQQTKIKHQLLRRYISPWMAILLRHQEKFYEGGSLLYFDGFSGPGLYWKDNRRKAKSLGSPLIVANVARKYLKENRKRKISIICTDKDIRNVKHLNYYLGRFNIRYNQYWIAFHSEFDSSVNDLLDLFEKKKFMNPPTFFFIDPFGYSGFPMETLKRIMRYPKVELFINFMIYEIIRRIGDRQFEQTMTSLFGTDEYKKALEIDEPEKKNIFLRNLYCNQLKKSAGAQFVMPFRINTPGQGRRVKYFLIHGSKNYKALELMKDNMAKLSCGDYNFEAIGLQTNQEDLFENPEKKSLREKIESYIISKGEYGVLFEKLKKWAYETTNGISRTIINELLVLENSNIIIINRKPRQRKNTVAKGARIRSAGK